MGAEPGVTTSRSVAVIGGGWAGLAAAIEATRRGHRVTLFEMATQLGGRARAVSAAGQTLDNGQHILIGAYTETLELMRTIGVDLDRMLLRTPLRFTRLDGSGIQLEPGAPIVSFARAVMRQPRWRTPDKLALLLTCARWALARFRCDPAWTVDDLCAPLPPVVRDELIDPLCVAALNTPAREASAQVFLRVLKDALFAGPGSSDLLLPRESLSELLPLPARRWLGDDRLRMMSRVAALRPHGGRWLVDTEFFESVIVAAAPNEAARLVAEFAPAWAQRVSALQYEPIVTVYLHGDGVRLPEPMLALHSDAGAPAQFVFDRGQLGGQPGLLAFVISGAQSWVDRGLQATTNATLAQARAQLGLDLLTVHVQAEKRATFRCTPGLARAPMQIAPGLLAAGDHVDGPYPATLEGAVRSGLAAARAVGS